MRKQNKKSYTKEFKAKVVEYAVTNTYQATSQKYGVSSTTVHKWFNAEGLTKTVKFDPQTLSFRVGKIKRYLVKRYKTLQLTNKQTFDELGLDRGKEPGKLLSTGKLNSLGVSDVARYIVLYT